MAPKRAAAPKKTRQGTDSAPAAKRSVDLLWGTAERPTRGPKPGLSLDRIVEAAIRIADADGIEAVSMQRVANEFHFTTMSLYRYVPGKSELIDLMVDAAVGAPPSLAALPGGWRPKLREWARQTWATFERHPWFLGAAMGRIMGPNQLGWLEAAIDALAPSGLRGQDLLDAALVVNGHVRSMAPQYVASNATAGGDPSDQMPTDQWVDAIRTLLTTHRDRFPALNKAIADGAFQPATESEFEFGLERILDGIEAYIDTRREA